MLDPAFTGSGASAIVIARSACVETVALAVDVFGVAGSLVVEVTVAVLLLGGGLAAAERIEPRIVSVTLGMAENVAVHQRVEPVTQHHEWEGRPAHRNRGNRAGHRPVRSDRRRHARPPRRADAAEQE